MHALVYLSSSSDRQQRHEGCRGPAATETSIRCKATLRDAIFNLGWYGLLGTENHVLYCQDRPKGFLVVLSILKRGLIVGIPRAGFFPVDENKIERQSVEGGQCLTPSM